MSMQKSVIVSGVMNMKGRSKRTGNDYSMSKMTVLEPYIIKGAIADAAGFEAREIDCEDDVMQQLRGVKFPCEVIAHMEIGRENKVRVSSVEPVKSAVVRPAEAKTA